MKDQLREHCERFIRSRDAIKAVYKHENRSLISICAELFASKGLEANEEEIRTARAMLKEKTGVFSQFRGTALELPAVCMAASDPRPEQRMDSALEIYPKLKKGVASEYHALGAMILSGMVSASEVDGHVERGQSLYKLMSKNHPIITSSEDRLFSWLLSFSEKRDEELIDDMEAAYQAVKKSGIKPESNATQTVSQIFALDNSPMTYKCERLISLYDAIKAAGRRYSKYHELGVLATVALVDADVSETVKDILEVDEYLSGVKGYGTFSIDKKTRLMHAAMIVSNELYSNNAEIPALTSTLAMIAAQNSAMCAIIAANLAASSAANAAN